MHFIKKENNKVEKLRKEELWLTINELWEAVCTDDLDTVRAYYESGGEINDLPAKTDSKKFRPMIQNARSIYFRISYG